jgi:hypothetical protein
VNWRKWPDCRWGRCANSKATVSARWKTLVRVAQALGLLEALDDLFVLKRQSIAQMEQVDLVSRRQRAPRKRTS